MHYRKQDPCENAIRRTRKELEDSPTVPLHTAFLNTALREVLPPGAPAEARDPKDPTRSRYIYFLLNLGLIEYRVREAGGLLADFKHLIGFDSEYAGAPIYGETLEIRVDVSTPSPAIGYRWYSEADAQTPTGWKTDAVPTARGAGRVDYSFPLRAHGAISGQLVIHALPWQPEAFVARA